MMDFGDHMSTGGWIFSILGMVVVMVLLVAAIVWIVSELGERRPGTQPPPSLSAREILDQRLARGEITTEQYDQLREKLDASAPSGVDPRPGRPADVPG
jgi:putative membrane protein